MKVCDDPPAKRTKVLTTVGPAFMDTARMRVTKALFLNSIEQVSRIGCVIALEPITTLCLLYIWCPISDWSTKLRLVTSLPAKKQQCGEHVAATESAKFACDGPRFIMHTVNVTLYAIHRALNVSRSYGGMVSAFLLAPARSIQ